MLISMFLHFSYSKDNVMDDQVELLLHYATLLVSPLGFTVIFYHFKNLLLLRATGYKLLRLVKIIFPLNA